MRQTQPTMAFTPTVLPRQPALEAKTATALNVPAKESRSAKPSTQVTTIKAKIDVGFGNNLFVRGQGAGLSWDHGIPLTCVDGQTWQWSAKADDRFTFKLLLNDTVWAKGEDLIAKPGQKVEIVPTF